jgi:hypothetical protein
MSDVGFSGLLDGGGCRIADFGFIRLFISGFVFFGMNEPDGLCFLY